MALEMKVYREISAYEARVMFGLSWRQLGALAIGIPLAGGAFAGIAVALNQTGQSWEDATNVAMWVIFPILIPVAAWGWWRPKGLKPEKFIGYLVRHYLNRKAINYDDTYRAEPLPGGSAAGGTNRTATRRRTVVPREHLRTAREDRAAARRTPQTEGQPGRH